jgi:hypothetical protein
LRGRRAVTIKCVISNKCNGLTFCCTWAPDTCIDLTVINAESLQFFVSNDAFYCTGNKPEKIDQQDAPF